MGRILRSFVGRHSTWSLRDGTLGPPVQGSWCLRSHFWTMCRYIPAILRRFLRFTPLIANRWQSIPLYVYTCNLRHTEVGAWPTSRTCSPPSSHCSCSTPRG